MSLHVTTCHYVALFCLCAMARGDCLLDANFCGRAVGHNDLVTAVVGAQSPAYTTCSFPKKSPKKSHLLGYFKIIFPFLIWHNQQKQR